MCKEYLKRIELSEHYVARNDRAHVVDTILHEIAHALVGTQHGHDTVWKAMCVTLGCQPRACGTGAEMPSGDWQAQCLCCREVFSRHRKPEHHGSLYCVACGPEKGKLKFSNVKLQYHKQVQKAQRHDCVQLMLKIF